MDSNEKGPLLIEPSPNASGLSASLGFQRSPGNKSPKIEKLNKPPRKRSRIACTWCRDRKVRCDASSHGVPCTNCELDQQECVVHSASHILKSSVFQSPRASSRSPLISQTWNGSDAAEAWNTPPLPGCASSTATQFGADSDVFYSFHLFLKLPGFSEIPQEDIQYLNLKGCFRVPSGGTLDEFVRKYFLYVHPCLPIINEAEFWQMYYHQSGVEQTGVTLFTFQAMLFAASAFVSSKAIKSAGFIDIRTARNVLYTRAKLLYDLNCEKSILSIIQGSLLLTHQSSSSDLHAGSLWLGIAIQNAIVYNALHPSSASNPSATPKQENIKRRIWWSILLRDRIIPLGLRRHPQITPQTKGLTGESCLTPLGERDLEDEISCSEVYDAQTKRLLARVLRIQCELALVFSDILVLVNSGVGTGVGLGFMGGAAFGKRQSQPESQTQGQGLAQTQAQSATSVKKQVASCKAALLKWSTNAKAALGAVVNSHMTHESVSLYFGLTFFYYHAARLALCNFKVLTLQLNTPSSTDKPTETSPAAAEEAEADHERIQDDLEDATGCITDTIKRFLGQGVAHHLPISTILLTAHPLLLSALDVKLSSTKSQSATRKRRFRYYANLMQVYQHRYDGTDTVAGFIQQTLQVADYLLPRAGVGFGVRVRGEDEGNGAQGQGSAGAESGTNGKRCGRTSPNLAPASWSELFANYPKLYLQLTLALDYGFSRGYFPAYTEIHELLGGGSGDVDPTGLDTSSLGPGPGPGPGLGSVSVCASIPASSILASDLRASPTSASFGSGPTAHFSAPNLVLGTGQVANLANLYTLLEPEHQPQPQYQNRHPPPPPLLQALPSQQGPAVLTSTDTTILEALVIPSYNPMLKQYAYPTQLPSSQLSFMHQDYACGMYTLRDGPLLDESGSLAFLSLGSSASEYSDGVLGGVTVGMVEEGVISA
ncbi:hypothetical protein BJX68DRAFT_276164 [Aspergillus pseudodeflectus]|uniref:Zn(2)-C6 fungal-type domain-containing protein n=1 Tax=Aspergillus pseudodeflectus TaxID=176178 RepID=A0ABR4KAB6_9EURO